MFSGKDAANAAYPTQWALNPTAYQNIDSSQVDWAALAQQWIAMKEAAVVTGPPAKPDVEEGEAPMEVENPDANCEAPVTPDPDWSASPNTWGGSWNQWGWGWPGAGPVDPKLGGDPAIAMAPIMDGYPVPEGTAPLPGYSTGTVSGPTFQHGYWTAPQAENDRSGRSRERRSKSKNRDGKPTRSRSQREKPPMIPPVIEPIVMPTPMATSTIDAAKRRQLPAWIREGLEKMEREKQKAIEREQEKKAREEAELEKKRLEEEELERLRAEAGGQPMLPAKSKFDSDSEGSQSGAEAAEGDASPLLKKTRDEIMQEVMIAVRRSLTEILLEVTDHEIQTVSQEELARYNSAQASRINALKASRSKALASIASGLGLGAYESSDDSNEDEPNDVSDQQLQEIIKRKRLEFERTSREIEAEVRKAELKESEEVVATPANITPERPRRSRSSATPPPVESETPEKKIEHRPSKDKRLNNKITDKVDGKKLDTIQEENSKKSNKHDNTPSPQKSNKPSKESTNSSSSDSEDDSSSSQSKSSSESEPEVVKVENSRPKKRKRKSSSSSESQKKSKKHKKEKYKPTDKHYSRSKHQEEYEKPEKTKSKKRDEYYDKHKSRSREYSHKDKYRDDSDDDRPRRRSKRSRSISYESRSGRRKSRDRSEDRSRRRTTGTRATPAIADEQQVTNRTGGSCG
ncbi:unnamed protein product, partial [Brenthis ino]